MKRVFVDKIASVAQHRNLSQELTVSADIPCEEGALIAARVLNNKSRYNQLELVSGRMATLKQGDIVVGALGHRNALRGYAGHLPDSLKTGDTVQLLNIGGVMGICDSANPEVGPPFDCEVLGAVLEFPYLGERIGVTSRSGLEKLEHNIVLDNYDVPVIALAGTCMDSGKTAAACAIISRLRSLGLRIAACKATGVSLRRDILAMEDAGADQTLLFADFGIVATTEKNGPALTRQLLARLAEKKPDVIILELGDGLLGEYGVDAILADEVIRKALTSVVLCATDPVAAWGGSELLQQQYGLTPTVVTGPATDNSIGVRQIQEKMNLSAINALTSSVELGDAVAQATNLQTNPTKSSS